MHVNLISGFPGETFDEAARTVDFVSDVLQSHPNATFLLNPFTLFPQTPIAADPAAFGIRETWCNGDMPVRHAIRLDAPTRRATHESTIHFDAFCRELEVRLGWEPLLARPGGRSAFLLYSSSGHSAIFKSRRSNALDLDRSRASGRSVARPRRRKQAFITGATGNVGRAAVAAFLDADWDVVAMQREPAVHLAGCTTLAADLYDLPDLSDALAGMDAILHCGSPRSLNRQEMLVGEIEASARLLDGWSTGNFVYTSSQTVYGASDRVLTEDVEPNPSNWYDLAKLTVERQVSMAAAVLGGPGMSLRLPLVFACEGRRREAQFLATLVRAVRSGVSFVVADEGVPDVCGTVYIGPKDLGRALLAAATAQATGVFNLSGGFVSWRMLLSAVSEATGRPVTFTFRKDTISREGEFRLPHSRTEFDCSRFAVATEFVPRELLQDIVAAAVVDGL